MYDRSIIFNSKLDLDISYLLLCDGVCVIATVCWSLYDEAISGYLEL